MSGQNPEDPRFHLPNQPRWDDFSAGRRPHGGKRDEKCVICNQTKSSDANPMYLCDNECGWGMHKNCIGVPGEVPDTWYCCLGCQRQHRAPKSDAGKSASRPTQAASKKDSGAAKNPQAAANGAVDQQAAPAPSGGRPSGAGKPQAGAGGQALPRLRVASSPAPRVARAASSGGRSVDESTEDTDTDEPDAGPSAGRPAKKSGAASAKAAEPKSSKRSRAGDGDVAPPAKKAAKSVGANAAAPKSGKASGTRQNADAPKPPAQPARGRPVARAAAPDAPAPARGAGGAHPAGAVVLPELDYHDGKVSEKGQQAALRGLSLVLVQLGREDLVDGLTDLWQRRVVGHGDGGGLAGSYYTRIRVALEVKNVDKVRQVLRDKYGLQV